MNSNDDQRGMNLEREEVEEEEEEKENYASI